jgi:hypothetical protein
MLEPGNLSGRKDYTSNAMAEVEELWGKVIPTVRAGVTGIGVWTALKTAVPIAFED